MIHTVSVLGDSVRLIHLPKKSPVESSAVARAWDAFTHSDAVFGFDVETTAIDEESGGVFDPSMKLRLIQFGTATEAWCLDPHEPEWRKEIVNLLHDKSKRFVSHTDYDVLWVRREFGIALGDRSIDTFPMAALLHPGVTVDKDLKSLSSRYIDDQLQEAADALHARFRELAPVGHRVGKKMTVWGFTNIPLNDEVFGLYGGLDAVYVRRLLDILAKLLKERKMAKLSRREQRVQRLSTGMEQRGYRIDMDWTHGALDAIEREYVEADTRLRDVFGFSPLSPRVPQWCEDNGAHFMEFTKGGNPELSKDTLPALAERYEDDEVLGPVFRDKLTLSRNKNLLSNLRIIVSATDANGYVHPKIKTMQAHTGRMSITKPAMQTFKKTDDRLRGCFIASEGKVLVGADYDSQEIRIAAALSRDPALLKIVREGLNQHILTAQLIYGDEFKGKEESPYLYKIAKILDFAQQYGAGPKKIAAQLGIPLAEAKAAWEGWRAAYSGLVRWTDAMGELRTVVNPWGRRIPCDPFRSYANGNYMVQSSGRDLLGDAMVELDDRGWGDTLWLPIHDELVLEVHEEYAEEAMKVLAESMHCEFGDIEIPASPEVIGKRWSGGS